MDNISIEQYVMEIKSDDLKRDKFIEDYKPFILGRLYDISGRYISTENDEEFSIGLLAFNEAIDRYDDRKGKFLSFSTMIIKNRLIDHFRKTSREADSVELDDKALAGMSNDNTEEVYLRTDMKLFEEMLERFGMDFEDLIDASPKHERTRIELMELAKKVALDEEVINHLYEKNRLPISLIALRYGETKKRVKTFKKYIISVVVIYKEKLETIIEYLD